MTVTAALLWSGVLVLGAIALMESFVLLPAAVAAYAGVGWVLALERHASRTGDRR